MRISKYSFLYKIIFIIEIISLFVYINSLSFYVLDKAKEKENSSSNKNSLTFIIKGGIDTAFDEDKTFKIKTEIYKDNQFIQTKNAECSLPRFPQAEFGATINANCEIDLSSINGNKIKFLDFIYDENEIKINDPKKYIFENPLSYTKKIENKPDIEFTAASIKSIKCFENKFIFGINGEINKYWIDKFSFDITLNENQDIPIKCDCPNIYFNSDITINCTITIENDINFINNLKRGIEIKENYINIENSKNEKKLFKLSIKNNKERIEFKEFNCSPNSNNYNNDRDKTDMEQYVRKSNRGNQYDNDKKDEKKDNDYNQYNKNRERTNQDDGGIWCSGLVC